MLPFFGLHLPAIPFLVAAVLVAIILFALMKKVVHLAFRLAAFGVIIAIIAAIMMRH